MFYKDGSIFTESEIKALNPNTSFPTPFVAPSDYTVVFETPMPTVGELQAAYQYGTEMDSKGNRVVKWLVRDTFSDYVNDEGVTVTKAEQEAEYMSVKILQVVKGIEQAVQSSINAKCVELGYDNENSIAKYLVVDNPFYDECRSISLWIGAVWVYVNQVKNDVEGGTRSMPATEELLAELPKYGE